MPRVTITFINKDSFQANITVEKGLELELGAVFAALGNRMISCSNVDIMDMKYDSILNSSIVTEVTGVNLVTKWNNLGHAINQFRAMGEFLKLQAFKMWSVPGPSKLVTPNKFPPFIGLGLW